mmetsp:Transcript_10514/g.20280  ORF Transcript_10514/g.20280 Transcript_10514/m.20280 type:complete len:211 (+) Transcript_10514:97-729(+)
MPVICIGPVCIPWTCLPAIAFFFWRFVKPWLPQSVAETIEVWAAKCSDALAPFLEKIPFLKKKKKKEANGQAATNGHGAANGKSDSSGFQPGVVCQISSGEHLDALLQKSAAEGFAVVLDFTAPWCKPCQAIKPRFHALAAERPGHCFAEVDADELDDVSARCEVMGLPTFQVYLNGQRAGSTTGGDESKLVSLIEQHLDTGGGPEKKIA